MSSIKYIAMSFHAIPANAGTRNENKLYVQCNECRIHCDTNSNVLVVVVFVVVAVVAVEFQEKPIKCANTNESDIICREN